MCSPPRQPFERGLSFVSSPATTANTLDGWSTESYGINSGVRSRTFFLPQRGFLAQLVHLGHGVTITTEDLAAVVPSLMNIFTLHKVFRHLFVLCKTNVGLDEKYILGRQGIIAELEFAQRKLHLALWPKSSRWACMRWPFYPTDPRAPTPFNTPRRQAITDLMFCCWVAAGGPDTALQPFPAKELDVKFLRMAGNHDKETVIRKVTAYYSQVASISALDKFMSGLRVSVKF